MAVVPIEERLHPRATVRLRAEARRLRDRSWSAVVLQEIGAGGASVRSSAGVNVDDELALRFRLPRPGAADLEVEVACRVVHADPPSPRGGSASCRYGVRFLDLDGPTFEAVRGWVWGRRHPWAG